MPVGSEASLPLLSGKAMKVTALNPNPRSGSIGKATREMIVILEGLSLLELRVSSLSSIDLGKGLPSGLCVAQRKSNAQGNDCSPPKAFRARGVQRT